MAGRACKPRKDIWILLWLYHEGVEDWCGGLAQEGHDLIHILQRLPLMLWEESVVGRPEWKPGEEVLQLSWVRGSDGALAEMEWKRPGVDGFWKFCGDTADKTG